ncbi:MAG: MFS transporter [Myxococcales bacterium]|nr:MFS transporter [Myxococcales bacterium]MCB9737390.1 MFS transporter [Deltaproteobacteria bacterium]
MSGGGGAPWTPPAPTSGGLRAIVRENRSFRLLWIGSLVSLFGDWFNTLAIFALVERLTPSPLAIGAVLAIKLFGLAVASVPGGLLADRVDRKRLMIAMDLSRALVVLGFLVVDTAEELPLLYALVLAQTTLGAAFDPAFRASLPNVVAKADLLGANTIFGTTWSVLLAVGAAVGGLATAGLGAEAVFGLDSATYLVSAWCVSQVALPRGAKRAPRGPLLVVAARDVREGWSYLVRHRAVGRVALAKVAWEVGGGALVYALTQIGSAMTPLSPSIGIGVLYAARGVGTGIGPLVARRVFTDERRWPVVMGACVVLSGAGYLLGGLVGWTAAMVPFVVVAHAGSGANWVLSLVWLQARVPDEVRGRVFGSEMVMVAGLEGLSTLTAAVLLETGRVGLAPAVFLFGGLQVAVGALWLVTIRRSAAMREAP